MREDFLHYLWKFKKFDTSNLYTVNGERLSILNAGNYHQLSGPDFFNAQIIIDDQKWAGNIEIHLKASDWYRHHHETDDAYQNVILHVVWEHDTEIYRQNNVEIPVLELRHYISDDTLQNYRSLTTAKSWIFCEMQLKNVGRFIVENWQERLFFERLERKAKPIHDLLLKTNSDWEAVLFCLLAKNFGLNTNGDTFFQIAQLIPYSIIRKESTSSQNVEALLFGFAGLLDDEKEDRYFYDLKNKFALLLQKYNLVKPTHLKVEFFKHRPDNFPTIRLSQLAELYTREQHLFSKIINAQTITEVNSVFSVSVSDYWKTHYQFDRTSPFKAKALSREFIALLTINTIVPLHFAYGMAHGKEAGENLIALLSQLPPENNAIVQKFASFQLPAQSAFESQALLQLKIEYCSKGRCLECAIGIELLKAPENQIV